MWYVVWSLAVIPKMVINRLVNLWIENVKSGLWDNWKDVTRNVRQPHWRMIAALWGQRAISCCTQFLSSAPNIDLLWPCLNIPWSSCTMHFLLALLLSPSSHKSYLLADSFNFLNEKLRLQNWLWKEVISRKMRALQRYRKGVFGL